MESKSIAEIIASYFWVGSMLYNSWMPNRLGCRIMVIRSTPSVFLWFCGYYHYTRFGEVLLFSSLKTDGRQAVRIMKFIRLSILFVLMILRLKESNVKMNITKVKDYEEMSSRAAEYLLKKIVKLKKPVIGLATGSTPEGLYK